MKNIKTKDDCFWYVVQKEAEWEAAKNYKPPAPPKPFKVIPLKDKVSIWAFCKELLSV